MKQSMISGNMKTLTGEARSWEMSHLPFLKPYEREIFMNVLRSWFEQSQLDVPGNCNIPLIWDYAERHGISGIIGSLAVAGKINDFQLKSLGQERYFSNMLYYEQCLDICRRLQDCARLLKIPMSFIKGPALIPEVYKDPGARAYSDIDIIVGSRENAFKLIDAMKGKYSRRELEQTVRNRFKHPGRIHAQVNNWELEFCYPVKWACDPMFELFEKYEEGFMKTSFPERKLITPDPDIYMVILIQHMARHLCSRLIWFLDIAAFVRAHRETLNFVKIKEELRELQILNISFHITRFCKEYIDRDFPIIELEQKGWNEPFQKELISARLINGRFSLNQSKGLRKYFARALSFVRFYIIADPQWQRLHCRSSADRWLISRLLYAIQINSKMLHGALCVILHVLTYPLLRLASVVFIKSQSDESRDQSVNLRKGV